MSFRLHFPVHHWIGSGLRSPTYSIAELTMGLSVWQTLQKSRLPYSGHGAKRGGIFYQNSPEEVERAWEQISHLMLLKILSSYLLLVLSSYKHCKSFTVYID